MDHRYKGTEIQWIIDEGTEIQWIIDKGTEIQWIIDTKAQKYSRS